MTKSIVFDLDGTLISCRHRQMAALRIVSKVSGLDYSVIWKAKRDGMTTHDALLDAGVSAIEAEEITSRWFRIVEDPYYLGYDRLMPGAAEALQISRDVGFRPVLLTARRSYRGLMMQVNALGISCLVDQILSVDPRNGPKQKATELLRLSAIAMIGDSEVDAHAAASASVPFYAVSTGQRSVKFFYEKLGLAPFDGVLSATTAALTATLNTEK